MRVVGVGLACALLAFASVSSASGYLTPLNDGVVVKRYLMHGGGGMTVWVSGTDNPDDCARTDIVHLKGDLPGHDRMVAAVLAASTSGRKVGFYGSGCEIIPFWGDAGGSVAIVINLWVVE
ncbi:hypothetical protein [Marilutibacter maris]|uniref:hypothetical protein n=1 Tax=Marilutibacter maris TaxID=1605891 RepID=UPI0011AE53F8|nr:hypothetical protein [Lysobacter maris]